MPENGDLEEAPMMEPCELTAEEEEDETALNLLLDSSSEEAELNENDVSALNADKTGTEKTSQESTAVDEKMDVLNKDFIDYQPKTNHEEEDPPITHQKEDDQPITHNKEENQQIIQNEEDNHPITHNDEENQPIIGIDEEENQPFTGKDEKNLPISNEENEPITSENEKETNDVSSATPVADSSKDKS